MSAAPETALARTIDLQGAAVPHSIAAPQDAIPPARRLHFMDNLRVALTCLIVVQHASFAYAPGNWWYFTDPRQQPLLAAFFVVNRSFRMSLFFLIAGYFMPYVYDRKGAKPYLKERFRRLGWPILGFLFLVFPPLMYAYYLNFRPYGPIDFPTYFLRIYWGLGGHSPAGWSGPAWPDRQIGHLWFTELLLVYALLYAVWRWLRFHTPLKRVGLLPEPRLGVLVPAMLLAAAGSYWMRLHYPIYAWGAVFGLIQLSPGDLPRDFVCFCLGVIAYRNNWLLRMPAATGYRWLGLGLACAGVFIIADLSGHSFFSAGGRDLQAMLYPCWETLTCFGFCLGLPILFREHFDVRGPLLERLSGASYGVYLFHLPLVVALQYALAGAPLPALAKFALVAAAALPASFALVIALRRSPAVRRII